MNAIPQACAAAMTESDAARIRIAQEPGDPLLYADWERVLFLHFEAPVEILRREVGVPLHVDTYEGRGIISLAAVTMGRFRPARWGAGILMPAVREQRFLNLRTYARWDDEPGAVFLWGWLSRPFGMPLPGGRQSPYSFADVQFEHALPENRVRGRVKAGGDLQFAYSGTTEGAPPQACVPGSLSAFALERYTGFFRRGTETRIFRAWHPAWQQTAARVNIEDRDLIVRRFPWFREAQLLEANFAPGFERVWLGCPHRLDKLRAKTGKNHKRLSVFFDMP
jgi:uncharacterized protein YqjF (DUF2071 family)